MPFIKGLPTWKLSKVPSNQHLIEKRDQAKREIEFWMDFLNKGTLTIEQQRKCLYLIEGAEIEYEKAVSEINANK